MTDRGDESRLTGFTLVELLVVIAITGLMMAMLLPAVQSAREAARRSSCGSKVKQVGVALSHHLSLQGSLPPAQEHNSGLFGDYDGKSAGRLPCQIYRGNNLTDYYSPAYPVADAWYSHPLNFVSALLPYVEEVAAYNALDFTKRSDLAPNVSIATRVFPFTQCPSHPQPGIAGAGGAVHHYGAPVFELDAWCTPNVMNGGKVAGIDGIFWGNSRCQAGHIRDGLSNTIAVVERLGYWPLNGNLSQRNGERGPFVDGAVYMALGPNPPYAAIWQYWKAPASGHPGGLYVGMADGSTTYVSNDIDIKAWKQLSARDDTKAFSWPF